MSDTDNGKTVAIICHFTLIGWIIAIIMHSNNKTELGSYYLRQMIGMFLTMFVLSWIPFLNLLAILVLFIFWIISLIGAINEEKKPIPLLGELFQDWFKGI